MRPFDERWIARGIVLLAVVAGAFALAPEIDIGRVDLNDSVFHYTIIDRLVDHLGRGEPVLDFWMPEWSFGYPVVRSYQPLGHWLVAIAHYATGKSFELDRLFSLVRWLLLAIFPLTAYVACRWTGMRAMTAAAVALLAPLAASPNLYGIEWGSYIWRGNGLYSQLVAMHLFVLAIGAGCRAIREGRRATLAGLLLALTFLAHFIYGYMAAATLLVAAALPSATPWQRRWVRVGWIAIVSLALTAFQIVPMLTDGAFINRSRWEPAWKWESFGAKQVLGLTASGNLLDANRLPIVSLLALAGAIAAIRRRHENDEERFVRTFALAGAMVWLFLFCGRASWPSLYKVLGLSEAAQIHRFIGAAQWFLLLLAGIGLARIWRMRRTAAALALTILLLWPPVAERWRFLQEGYGWGRTNLVAYESHRESIEQVIARAKAQGGRTYPGLAAAWGAQNKIGYVPLYAFLSEAHVPAVAFLYHAMALPADVMVRFDETRPEHYRLFDVRAVIAEAPRQLPAFLQLAATHGALKVLQPPKSGAFDLVHVPYSHYVDRRTFYEVNDAWLQSGWTTSATHLLLDYESAIPTPPLPRLPSLQALGYVPPPKALGAVTCESLDRGVHRAELTATANCYLLFKATYHPRWRATVDGKDARIVMLSPGFIGVPVTAGTHRVELRYAPGAAKLILLILALPLLIAAFYAERRGLLDRVNVPQFPAALLLILLVLPAAAPFLGGAQPNGHDASQYLPRLVEFHENIRAGNLLPRWAPDLSSGQGQPIFLFNPPLFNYLSEIFYLLGLSFVGAMNATCVLLILASAASMYLLGRHWFGPAGGAVAAIAYVYAPYFLIDLYVRTAFAEFSAFPFYPLALYGFARGTRKHLILGIVAYAATWYAHTPAAVLFSPLLGCYLLFLAWRARSWRMFFTYAASIAVALLIAATIWLPGLAEARDTNSHHLTTGPLQYSNHYVAPSQFFWSKWGYGTSVPGPEDGMPFTLGWAHLIIAAIAAIVIWRSGDEAWRQWLAFFALAAFLLCFLMTQRAHGVWDAIPQLHYVAFPWRLLAPVTLCLALLTAAIALAIAKLPETWHRWAYAAVIAAIVLSTLPHVKPHSYLTFDPAQWTPRQLAVRGVIPATFDTFEPRWVQQRPVYTGDAIAVTSGSAVAKLVERKPTRFVASVVAAGNAEVELPVAYFPGWRVSVGGAEFPAGGNLSPTGRMRILVGPGTHRIEARFGRTPVRWVADLTSLAAFVLLLVFAIRRSPVRAPALPTDGRG